MRHAHKKGQVTTYVILGIFIVALIILIFFLRNQFFFGPVTQGGLDNRFEAIKGHIQDCIEEVGSEPIERIGKQGGYLSTPEDTYRLHQDTTISFLCYNIENQPTCYNRALTTTHMEDELSEAIKQDLSSCINLAPFKRGTSMTIGDMQVQTDIGSDQTIVTVLMEISLQQEALQIMEDTFSHTFNVPLGRLYDVSMDIVDIETSVGEFEQLSYMLVKRGQYVIEKKKPYPDKLYILKTKDSPYIFQFFIEGEPS